MEWDADADQYEGRRACRHAQRRGSDGVCFKRRKPSDQCQPDGLFTAWPVVWASDKIRDLGVVNSASVSPGQTVPTLSGPSPLPRHTNLHQTEVRGPAERPLLKAPVEGSRGRNSPPHLLIDSLQQTFTTRLCSSSCPYKFSSYPPCSGPTRLTSLGNIDTSLSLSLGPTSRSACRSQREGRRIAASQADETGRCLTAYIHHLRRGL